MSFRIFEALALQKKIITSNLSIKQYDFYNPKSIFVLDTDNINIPIEFIESPFYSIDNTIYEKYTIKNWVKTVFKI